MAEQAFLCRCFDECCCDCCVDAFGVHTQTHRDETSFHQPLPCLAWGHRSLFDLAKHLAHKQSLIQSVACSQTFCRECRPSGSTLRLATPIYNVNDDRGSIHVVCLCSGTPPVHSSTQTVPIFRFALVGCVGNNAEMRPYWRYGVPFGNRHVVCLSLSAIPFSVSASRGSLP